MNWFAALSSYIDDRTEVAVLLALAIASAAALRYRPWKPWHSRIRRKMLMTANEVEFLRRLERALPRHYVFPQVSFGAFLTDDGSLPGQARWSIRSRFDRKIADYVICDRKTLSVVALIELDDRTHVASADRQRDAITKAAGYQTFRFESKRKPSEAEIAELFRHLQAWSKA